MRRLAALLALLRQLDAQHTVHEPLHIDRGLPVLGAVGADGEGEGGSLEYADYGMSRAERRAMRARGGGGEPGDRCASRAAQGDGVLHGYCCEHASGHSESHALSRLSARDAIRLLLTARTCCRNCLLYTSPSPRDRG